jgi:hypothetical protein
MTVVRSYNSYGGFGRDGSLFLNFTLTGSIYRVCFRCRWELALDWGCVLLLNDRKGHYTTISFKQVWTSNPRAVLGSAAGSKSSARYLTYVC